MSPRLVRALIAGAAVAGFAAALVTATGGGEIKIAGLSIRSHDPTRPALLALLLTACALAAGTSAVHQALAWWWDAIERRAHAAAVLIAAAAVAVGVIWGTFVAGGSDSYCYINQAELFTRGQVLDYEPLATDPAWPGNVWSFAPAGHLPAARAGFYVPICPAGYPFLLAGARLIAGRTGMFWVTPIMGALGLYMAFLLGRRVAGATGGLLTALLTACSPVLLSQIVQPMNDVPAAAMWLTALVLASARRPDPRLRVFLAGLATAYAVTIRPNLVPLAAVVGLGAAWLPPSQTLRQRLALLVIFGAASIPGVLAVMAVQQAMFGSPMTSGYGDLSALFSTSNILPNLTRYPRWLIEVHTPLIAAALAAPFVLARSARPLAAWLLAFVAVTFGLYLPYVVFDAWWYLRFLLPAIPPLIALAVGVVMALLQRTSIDMRVLAFAALCIALPITFVKTAVQRDAFLLWSLEARFRSGGEFVATLPPNTVVITNHQSGSVRFYSGRSTAGWGDITPGRLDDAVAFMGRKGLKTYFLFEEWEEADFRRRFGGDRLGGLNWPPVAEIDRDVRVYDPDDYERVARGERVDTRQVVTGRR